MQTARDGVSAQGGKDSWTSTEDKGAGEDPLKLVRLPFVLLKIGSILMI